MKKFLICFAAVIIVFSFASCNKNDASEQTNVNSGSAPVVHAPSDTKIFNDFAAQLPNFVFKSAVAIVDNYEESLNYKFTVKSDSEEFKQYVSALKEAGFVSGYPESAPVSGDGYYKASNADKYMVEAVLMNGNEITVTVTRP